MIVVASKNGDVGIQAAVDVLRSGGSALDAVEAGIRLVEANPDDHTVGYNGYPNLLGELELDASIMDGSTMETGAVAGMKGYVYSISVARKVMEKLPHVLLVGDGAERFAAEMGFEIEPDMLTDEIKDFWEERLKRDMPVEVFDNIKNQPDLSRWVMMASNAEHAKSTINFIAQDKDGNIASGVSTSGWAWKYPGRVGDSPIIGAGNYADNRYGACACTGMGEMAIRAATSHSLVFYLKMGLSLHEAATRAMEDLNDLQGKFISDMNLVALDHAGNHAGFTSERGKTYIYQTDDMPLFEETERQFVAINHRWNE